MSETRALILLTTIEGVGSARISTIVSQLRERQISFEVLLEQSEADLANDGVLTSTEAQEFIATKNREQVDDWLSMFDDRGIQAIPVTSAQYPQQLIQTLGNSAPAVVYVYGDSVLLHSSGIAFAGARDVSSEGITVTERLAQLAVENGFSVISGGARGTDDAAHQAAADAGGATIFVLVEGILSSRAKSLLANIDGTSGVIVSTFLPDAPWQTWRAMERNKYILGLANRLIVIEAGDTGGTLAAGKEALKRNIPTWVVEYEEIVPSAPGNETLLRLGAQPVPVLSSGQICVPPALFAPQSKAKSSLQQRPLF